MGHIFHIGKNAFIYFSFITLTFLLIGNIKNMQMLDTIFLEKLSIIKVKFSSSLVRRILMKLNILV